MRALTIIRPSLRRFRLRYPDSAASIYLMKTTTTVDAVAGISAGIDFDGVAYTALTMVDSRHFKTYAGAVRWLKVRGYNADGTRVAS